MVSCVVEIINIIIVVLGEEEDDVWFKLQSEPHLPSWFSIGSI